MRSAKENTKDYFKIFSFILCVIKTNRQLPHHQLNRHRFLQHAETKLKIMRETFRVLKNAHKFTYQLDLNLFLAVAYLYAATKKTMIVKN